MRSRVVFELLVRSAGILALPSGEWKERTILPRLRVVCVVNVLRRCSGIRALLSNFITIAYGVSCQADDAD
jgi:hypothetical protein